MNNAQFTLTLDLLPERFRIEHDAYHSLIPEPLAMPGMKAQWYGKSIRTELTGSREECMRIFQKLVTMFPPLEDSHVVIGICEDPFQAGISGFLDTFHLVNILKAQKPARLEIQTRSPLILLLVPLLKSFGKRVEIVFSLECIDDSSGAKFTPDLPRVSERLRAARALHRSGIPVSFQFLPILEKNRAHEKLKNFARVLSSISDQILLLDELRGSLENYSDCLPIADSVRIFSEILGSQLNESCRGSVKSRVQLFRDAA